MKKNFRNFLLLTLVVSIVGATGMELPAFLFGPVAIFFGAVITVFVASVFLIFVQINKNT